MDAMLVEYLPILIFFAIATAIAGIAVGASYIVVQQRPFRRPGPPAAPGKRIPSLLKWGIRVGPAGAPEWPPVDALTPVGGWLT